MQTTFLQHLLILLLSSFLVISCHSPDREKQNNIRHMIETEQYAPALELLEAELQHNPKHPEFLALQTTLFLHAKRADLAFKTWEKLEKTKPQSPLVLDALKHPDSDIQITAIQTLGLKGSPSFASPLIQKWSQSQDSDVRRAILVTLGNLRNPEATNLLISTLQDPSWALRAEAAQALGKIRNPQAVIPLFEAMADEDSSVQLASGNALLTLARLPNAPANLYAKYSASPSPETRKIALIGLALQQDKRATAGLLELLSSPSPQDQAQAIRALGLGQDPQALPALRQALQHQPLPIRMQAIEALGHHRDTASIPLLKKIAANPAEPEPLKRQAALALLEITQLGSSSNSHSDNQ